MEMKMRMKMRMKKRRKRDDDNSSIGDRKVRLVRTIPMEGNHNNILLCRYVDVQIEGKYITQWSV